MKLRKGRITNSSSTNFLIVAKPSTEAKPGKYVECPKCGHILRGGRKFNIPDLVNGSKYSDTELKASGLTESLLEMSMTGRPDPELEQRVKSILEAPNSEFTEVYCISVSHHDEIVKEKLEDYQDEGKVIVIREKND